jgi:hypothetical protein
MKRWLGTALLLVGLGLPVAGQANGVRSPRDSFIIVHGFARSSGSFDSSRLASPHGQTTTVLCEAGLSRCVCTYNRRPGEFSYELNWIVPTLPPVTTTLARYWDRQNCLVAMGQAPECQR